MLDLRICRRALVAAAIGTHVVAPAAGAQPPATGIVLTHIGVAVHDAARSAQAYADLAGIDPPTIDIVDHAGLGRTRTAVVSLSNLVIELLEPVEDGSALARFLTTGGQGVHHLGLTRGPEAFSEHDLTASLGLLLHHERSREALAPAPIAEPSLAHPTCVTHIGIVVRDIARARRALADAIGVEGTPTTAFDEARGQASYTAFNLDNASIELLQQAGDGTGSYADFVEANGPRAHHLGVHLRGTAGSLSMQEQVTWLEQRDGQMAVDAGGFAYIDLRPRLGLFIEALSPAANDRVYPHPHPTP